VLTGDGFGSLRRALPVLFRHLAAYALPASDIPASGDVADDTIDVLLLMTVGGVGGGATVVTVSALWPGRPWRQPAARRQAAAAAAAYQTWLSSTVAFGIGRRLMA